MRWTSILAIYFLFFAATAFVLLPFGVRTDEEAGTPKVPGQADSAPHKFDIKRHLLKAALVADRLGQRSIELAHVRRQQRNGDHPAVALREHPSQHGLEIVHVTVDRA